jgi:hypothetical protein
LYIITIRVLWISGIKHFPYPTIPADFESRFKMEAALEQVRKLAALSEDGRRHAMVALHDLAHSFETPHDTIHRYGHAVWLVLIMC